MLVCGVRVGLGRVNCSVTMLGRRIEGIKPERLLARVDDVVPGSRRDDYCIVAFDLRSMTVNQDLDLAFFDTEELIYVVLADGANASRAPPCR